jgi:hypothetical protein
VYENLLLHKHAALKPVDEQAPRVFETPAAETAYDTLAIERVLRTTKKHRIVCGRLLTISVRVMKPLNGNTTPIS